MRYQEDLVEWMRRLAARNPTQEQIPELRSPAVVGENRGACCFCGREIFQSDSNVLGLDVWDLDSANMFDARLAHDSCFENVLHVKTKSGP